MDTAVGLIFEYLKYLCALTTYNPRTVPYESSFRVGRSVIIFYQSTCFSLTYKFISLTNWISRINEIYKIYEIYIYLKKIHTYRTVLSI